MNCQDCGTNNCYISLEEIQNFIYNIEEKIKSLVCKRIDKYYYGYDCETDTCDLELYKFLLEKYLKDTLRGVECVCPDVIQKIISKLHQYIPKPEDIDRPIDKSKEEEWIRQNLKCTTKAKWKKLAYKICHELEIDIRIVPEEVVCDLALDIQIGNLDCNVVEALSVSSIACQQQVKVDRTEQECKVDHKLLLESLNDGPSFKTYMNAVRKHHMTFEQIKEIYKNGLSIESDKKGNCQIKTSLRSYPLDQLTFKNYFESDKVTSSGLITLKPSEIKRFQQDYKKLAPKC